MYLIRNALRQSAIFKNTQKIFCFAKDGKRRERGRGRHVGIGGRKEKERKGRSLKPNLFKVTAYFF